MPYKDADMQRKAVNKAVKKHMARKQAGKRLVQRTGRPIGSTVYDTPEALELAISRQERRVEELLLKKARYQRGDKEYKNLSVYVSETKGNIRHLKERLEAMRKSAI